MIHLLLILIIPLCWFFYNRGYVKAMDDFDIIHGKDAERFIEMFLTNKPPSKEGIARRKKAVETYKDMSIVS